MKRTSRRHLHSVMFLAIVTAMVLAWLDGSVDLGSPPPSFVALVKGPVSYVVDGDTLHVNDPTVGLVKIRIWGIDAPEMDTAAGPPSRDSMADLIAGQPVACEALDQDQYGRIVARCRTAETSDLGAELIDVGHAVEYCSFSRNHYGTC